VPRRSRTTWCICDKSMLETKEQKRTFIACIVIVIILGLITACSKPDFKFADNHNYNQQSQDVQSSKAYLDYINSLKIDPSASKDLFQNIISEDDIRKEVAAELQINQPITLPTINSTAFNVTKASGQNAVTQYLTDSVGPVVAFNKQTATLNQVLFSSDSNVPNAVRYQLDGLQSKLTGIPVPQEAMTIHTALLSVLSSYKDLTQLATGYSNKQLADPWANVYKDYAAINQSVGTYNKEYQKLDNKYKLSSLPDFHYAEKQDDAGFFMVPKAQALFGLGDLTITVGDIPSLIMDAIKQGLTSSFTQFMSTFLNKVIAQIESNYAIANFLYYSDALVSGQYANDYLDKYVKDPLDRKVIQQFIPQFSCGAQNNSALKPLFQAKAMQNLGFDPSSLNPKDPNYYEKLAHVGDFLSSPQGWQLQYQSLADQAESASQQAIDRELSSSGLKSPRSSVTSDISNSITSIVSGESASFNAMMNLGAINASSFISSFVALATQNLINKFVFSGAVKNSSGQIAVLKEQSTCLAAAQLQVVIPVSSTQYQQPPPAPTTDQLLNSECAKLPRGCTTVGGTTGN
jgi:hypothetical protein